MRFTEKFKGALNKKGDKNNLFYITNRKPLLLMAGIQGIIFPGMVTSKLLNLSYTVWKNEALDTQMAHVFSLFGSRRKYRLP